MNFSFLTALLFPRRCPGCKKRLSEGVVCSACLGAVAVHRTLACGACGARAFADKIKCHPSHPYILGTAAGYHAPVVRSLIHILKFERSRGACEPLAALLIEYARSIGTLFDGCVVVPIPLSPKRLMVRGFNQSEFIAHIFAKALRLPLDTHTLIRVKHAKPQSETADLSERKNNLRGCFSVADATPIAGKNIVLIDDVTTSGTTFLEASRTLKAVGAGTIYALAVAQA